MMQYPGNATKENGAFGITMYNLSYCDNYVLSKYVMYTLFGDE
jgi:hypothetical protein